MVRCQDSAKHFGGWSPEALTKFSIITKAVTESRTMKRTKIADKWLLKAIHDWHKYVEKGEKKKKVKISAPKANTAEVVIVPFDCEKDTEAKAEDVDLAILGINLLDIESEHALVVHYAVNANSTSLVNDKYELLH